MILIFSSYVKSSDPLDQIDKTGKAGVTGSCCTGTFADQIDKTDKAEAIGICCTGSFSD